MEQEAEHLFNELKQGSLGCSLLRELLDELTHLLEQGRHCFLLEKSR
jgi:hypothetical protein